jgi:hypothetical protein
MELNNQKHEFQLTRQTLQCLGRLFCNVIINWSYFGDGRMVA